MSIVNYEYKSHSIEFFCNGTNPYQVFLSAQSLDNVFSVNVKFEYITVVQAYQYASRSGLIEFCCWLDKTCLGIVGAEIWESQYLPLFELASMATMVEHERQQSEEYKTCIWLSRIDEFIPGAKVLKWADVKGKMNIETQLRPDFILDINCEIIPGESKVVPFNKHHLKQLQKYMALVNSDKGIALAPSLNVDIPKGIDFYKI